MRFSEVPVSSETASKFRTCFVKGMQLRRRVKNIDFEEDNVQ